MELKIQNFPVKQVCFGSENAYRDGMLTLDKQAAIDYLMGLDEHITELDIEIANPGDDTRIVPVIETIEPRCHMDGRTLFPGVTGEVVPAGEGELKALKGCCVTVVGKVWGSFGDGVIAMVTTGGIVPVDNPDRIQSASATRWGRYDISGMERLAAGEFKTIHAGFDPAAANADPNVIVPLDAMRTYEKEHRIGRLHSYFYSTVGTGTTEAEARRMTKEIIPYLHDVSQTVGANRIVPTISIPYPLGDPNTPEAEQWKLRYHRVGVALEALETDVKEQTVFKTRI